MGSGTEGPFTSDDSHRGCRVVCLYGTNSSITTVPVIMFGIGFRSPGVNAILASIGALIIVPTHWRRR